MITFKGNVVTAKSYKQIKAEDLSTGGLFALRQDQPLTAKTINMAMATHDGYIHFSAIADLGSAVDAIYEMERLDDQAYVYPVTADLINAELVEV